MQITLMRVMPANQEVIQCEVELSVVTTPAGKCGEG